MLQAFMNSNLKEVVIPASISSIGQASFGNTIELKKVEFEPNSQLETINTNSFAGSGITSIEIPKNIEYIIVFNKSPFYCLI